jgi:undecaprenyl-diphosphatase
MGKVWGESILTLLHIVVLALVQGITEFLPISSSGHLILVPVFTGWPDQGLVLDVAVHVGTLGAVMAYFWRDLWTMVAGLGRLARGREDAGARLAGLVIVATVPVIAAGFVVNAYMYDDLRSLTVIAWTMLGFGIVLYVTDRLGMTVRRIEHTTLGDAVVIGLAQVLALVPGTSRAGITMSAGRMLGLERTDAARFSMLLSIPAILGAGALKSWELYQADDADLTANTLVAAGLAFTAAWLAIFLMMAWLRHATFTPFVIYRVVLGAFLLGLAYGAFA